MPRQTGARLRRRYLAAIGVPLLASAACGGSAPPVGVPVAEGPPSPPEPPTRLVSEPAPLRPEKPEVDPPEPERPSWAVGEGSPWCKDDPSPPSVPELAPPFQGCVKTLGPGQAQFSAKATRARRADVPDACCYVTFHGLAVPGRPLVADEASGPVARVARPSREASGWQGDLRPEVDALPVATRALLAEAWLRDAAFEHASVASFARFALELLALGAPPELLDAAHAAARDEIAHARVCYALASHYAGTPIGPGPLAVPGPRDLDLATLATTTFVEGCAGETLAAALLRRAARTTRDPVVARVLRQLARDEERHAELAWRTCAWAARRGGDEVREAIARAASSRPEVPPPVGEGLDPHGHLSTGPRRRIVARTWARVVVPCAAAIVAPDARRTAGA